MFQKLLLLITGKSDCFVIKWNNRRFWKFWRRLYDDCANEWPSICIDLKIHSSKLLDVASTKGNSDLCSLMHSLGYIT